MCRRFGTLCLFRLHGWCKNLLTTSMKTNTDAGTSPKRKNTFRTWRKFEIKKMDFFPSLHFIMRILKKGNNNTKRLAYTALVRPILEYGAVCWDPYGTSETDT
jgi:hypothetical protein